MSSSAARRVDPKRDVASEEPALEWTEEELAKLRRQKERMAAETASREGIASEEAMAQVNASLADCTDDQLHLIADQDDVDPDEPLDPELEAALDESDAQIARGEVVPWEVVRAEMRLIRHSE